MTQVTRLLRSEWTKFRTVPGWVRAAAAAALMIVLFPLTGLAGGAPEQRTTVPIGPHGEPVSDAYFFVHRPLAGDGSITVAVTAPSSTSPWAKAGLIVSAGDEPGARYAAIMMTAAHGVRMQHDYLHDRAAAAGGWLRLTRAGDTVTGEVSADGASWSEVDSVRLAGLSGTVQVGLFVACPPLVDGIGTAGNTATATFSDPQLTGAWWPAADWTGDQRGAGTATFAGYPSGTSGGFTASGDGFTVTGAGDLGPAPRNEVPVGATAADLLFGTFPALVVIVVMATQMITTEFRTRLIRTTFSASPHRVRLLAAKAAVLAGVTFTVCLAATVIAVPLWLRVVRGLGLTVFPATDGTLLRAEAGTAALLAVTAVFALAVGTVVRRGATAVTAVVVATVLPHLLARTPFLPPPMAEWLATFTPAAAMAVQQTLTRYPQVDSVYTPATGYYPLSPWAGLAVLCTYTALTFALAVVLLRRRDA
ncbi:hypothetical protein GCM10009827_091980 [Dactylosporangium maewongense]|uniref:DUF1349 domain-containing protein n=1 Tax=Dactylosporangium maewongense TaxID=634393 RepID=A0ABN2CEC8_9ACTN